MPAATAQYDAGCAEVTMQVEKGGGPIPTFDRVLPTPAALGGRCAEESPACHIRLLQTDWLALGPDVSPDPSLDPEVLFYAMEGFARVGDVNVRATQTAQPVNALDADEFLLVFEDAVVRAEAVGP